MNGDERREMRDRLFLLRRGWRRTQWGWRHPGLGARDYAEGAALTLGLAAAERFDRRQEGTSRASESPTPTRPAAATSRERVTGR